MRNQLWKSCLGVVSLVGVLALATVPVHAAGQEDDAQQLGFHSIFSAIWEQVGLGSSAEAEKGANSTADGDTNDLGNGLSEIGLHSQTPTNNLGNGLSEIGLHSQTPTNNLGNGLSEIGLHSQAPTNNLGNGLSEIG